MKIIQTTILALALAAGASAQTAPKTAATQTAPDPKDQQIAQLQAQLQAAQQQIQLLQLHLGQLTDSLLNAQAQVEHLQATKK